MGDWHSPQGPFDIPDVPDRVTRRVKPWLFVFFVLIIQFSGGLYLAAASDMVGTTALMQEDILMAGYAQLVGMTVNFAVMFRLKFRFSNRVSLLVCGFVLIVSTIVCATTKSVPLLVVTCFVAGWFRMWGTFACNSTIQLWITPKRDMAVFFCYVYLIVDGVIQLSGIFAVYTAFFMQWEYMHWTMVALLALMMLMVMVFVRPVKGPMQIPLLGIDWIGSALWSVVMLCFVFVCVYGNYFDWWHAEEICGASLIGLAALAVNLWRASFLRHPYISFQALTNRNVIRATGIYLVFFTIMATEHVFEHSYAAEILGFDETNLVDLNLYVLAGIVFGVALTYLTFARRQWGYTSMALIGFVGASAYLAYFYFLIDYGVEKEMLFAPLFIRGASSVVISIVFLTSIVHSGLHFFVFPQALTINGFTGAVMGATLGPALIGELLRKVMASNSALISSAFDAPAQFPAGNTAELFGLVQRHALVVSMKEIYGWLLIVGLITVAVLAVRLMIYGHFRPSAIFPKWSTVRRSVMKIAFNKK